MNNPIADPATIPNYFVVKEASKYVKIVFSEVGTDELFGGYNIYRKPLSLKMFDYIHRFLKRSIHQLAQGFPKDMKGKSFLIRGTTPLAERYFGNSKIFEEKINNH